MAVSECQGELLLNMVALRGFPHWQVESSENDPRVAGFEKWQLGAPLWIELPTMRGEWRKRAPASGREQSHCHKSCKKGSAPEISLVTSS